MIDLNALPLPDLYAELARRGHVTRLLELSRDEDLGPKWEQGDVTSRACVTSEQRGRAKMVMRQGGVVCGLVVLAELLHVFRADVDVTLRAKDGAKVEGGTTVAEFTGSLRAILGVERTALNFVGRLSGVATRTAEFVARLAGTKAVLLDTRKTTPGLRMLEKYAVRCGGGQSHRLGLHDAVLIKDNHLAAMAHGVPVVGAGDGTAAKRIEFAAQRARRDADRGELRFLELEVDSLDQLREVIAAGLCGTNANPPLIDMVLLDNMTPGQLREAVAMRDGAGAKALLEASGGVTIESVGEIAKTGVDRISTGAITHGAVWLDVSLDVE